MTQGLEGGLRSRGEAGVRYEVAGHLLLYQCLRWLLCEAAQRAGEADPLRLSYQEALEELTDLRPALVGAGRRRVAVLVGRLLGRFILREVNTRSCLLGWRSEGSSFD